MKEKILVLNDGSKYENWGIKACIDGVKNIFGDDIVGIPHSYMHKKYNIDPVIKGRKLFNENSRIAKKFFKEYHRLPKVSDEFEFFADLWCEGNGGYGANDFIKTIESVDVIIFNAEGSTYRDNIGALKGLFMIWLAKTRFNKKTYFINGSVTLTDVDSTLPAMIHKVFSVIDGVTVRERVSKRNILTFYPDLESKIEVAADSVFSLAVEDSPLKIKPKFFSEEYFCFSLSMLPMDYKQTKSRSSLVALINELKKIVPVPVLLAKDVEDQILKDLSIETGAVFIGADYNYQEVMEVLSGAKFLLSGRYHHLIFASKVGCPMIALNTSSHKIKGLCEYFENLVKPPFDPTNLWLEKDDILLEAARIVKDKYLKFSINEVASKLSLESYKHKMY
jgi:hypothetical protein